MISSLVISSLALLIPLGSLAAQGPASPDDAPVVNQAGMHQESLEVSEMSLGAEHSCALTEKGTAYCWGNNEHGQLGDGTRTSRKRPTRVLGDRFFKSISAGGMHTCALTRGGIVYCWGLNNMGQLGIGIVPDPDDTTSVPSPRREVAGNHTFTEIAAGGAHTCGRSADGTVLCWGNDRRGQVGSPTDSACRVRDPTFSGTTNSPCAPSPQPVAVNQTFRTVTAGAEFACALNETGTPFCWGLGKPAFAGDDAQDCPLGVCNFQPTRAPDDHVFQTIDAGHSHVCAVSEEGGGYCWGRLALGHGSEEGSEIPVRVNGDYSFTKVAAGTLHTCGLTRSGAIYCWGHNAGRVLLGPTDSEVWSEPRQPISARTFEAVDLGGPFACARAPTGILYCWGGNGDGQLGDGTTKHRAQPAPILPPDKPEPRDQTTIHVGSLLRPTSSVAGAQVQVVTVNGEALGPEATGEEGSVRFPVPPNRVLVVQTVHEAFAPQVYSPMLQTGGPETDPEDADIRVDLVPLGPAERQDETTAETRSSWEDIAERVVNVVIKLEDAKTAAELATEAAGATKLLSLPGLLEYEFVLRDGVPWMAIKGEFVRKANEVLMGGCRRTEEGGVMCPAEGYAAK